MLRLMPVFCQEQRPPILVASYRLMAAYACVGHQSPVTSHRSPAPADPKTLYNSRIRPPGIPLKGPRVWFEAFWPPNDPFRKGKGRVLSIPSKLDFESPVLAVGCRDASDRLMVAFVPGKAQAVYVEAAGCQVTSWWWPLSLIKYRLSHCRLPNDK